MVRFRVAQRLLQRCLLIVVLLGFSGSALAFDFTPHYAEVNEDGITTTKLYFEDGGRKIFLTVPPDWIVEGNEQQATMNAAGQNAGTVIFRLTEGKPLPLDEKGLEACRALALGLAPKDAAGAAITTETPSPLPINGWTSHQIQIGYEMGGVPYVASILFVKIKAEEQLQIVTAARAGDYPAVARGVTQAMHSWRYRGG